jgi:ABC-type nitrate/sulfonate/bicarbonate transport system substrate-binding protein
MSMNDDHFDRRRVLKGVAATAAGLVAAPYVAHAATETLRVAKSIPDLLAYTPIDVGLAKGFYQKRGLELEVLGFSGSARMHQAMTAGEVDIALGSGSTMVDAYKGEPSICIAQTMGPPVDIAIVVPYDSPIKTTDDLKGKTIGVASAGSPTEWVVFELARLKGWTRSDVKTVGLGGTQAAIAALRVHQVDAVVSGTAVGFLLEPQKAARVLVPCSDYVRDFIMHANYASQKIAETKPAVVKAFCAAWFESVAFMRTNKEESLGLVAPVTHLPPEPQLRDYDLVVPHLSLTGRFDPKGIAAIARSYLDLKILDHEPDMSKLYTEKFLSA